MNAYEFIINLRNQASNELRRVAQEVGVVDNRVRQTNKNLAQTNTIAKGLGNTFSNLRSKMVGIFAGIGVMAATQQVISARAEYEKFDAVLTNTFQSKDIGQSALAMITDFAANTPYQLNELTGGFIKLANRGIAPTYLEMTKMGDLAASQGKSFDQLVEAIMDAQTGEFERMKEFGVKASKDGDRVRLTFKGVTTEIANNEKAIKDTIIAYGGMKGVGGSMEAVSKTLGGRLSNLEDQWWGFLVAVGGYGGGILGDVLTGLGDGLAFVQSHLPEISQWFNILTGYVQTTFDAFINMLGAIFGINEASEAVSIFADTAIWGLVVASLLGDTLTWIFQTISQNTPIVYGVIAAYGAFHLISGLLALRLALVAWYTGLSTSAIIINTLVTEGWAAAWLAINIAMTANPIGIIIVAIAALVGLVVYAWNRFGWFRGAILGVWEVLKGFGTAIKNYVINRFTELLKGVTGLGEALVAFFNGDWKKAWELGKKSAGELMGLESGKKLFEDGKNAFGEFDKGWKEGNKETSKSSGGLFSDKFNEIKNSFSGVAKPKEANKSAYEDYLNKLKNGNQKAPGSTTASDKSSKDKKSDGIVSGGSKQTNITININKLQDHTIINVDKSEKGISELGNKVQEILLRSVNSVNQIETNGI